MRGSQSLLSITFYSRHSVCHFLCDISLALGCLGCRLLRELLRALDISVPNLYTVQPLHGYRYLSMTPSHRLYYLVNMMQGRVASVMVGRPALHRHWTRVLAPSHRLPHCPRIARAQKPLPITLMRDRDCVARVDRLAPCLVLSSNSDDMSAGYA